MIQSDTYRENNLFSEKSAVKNDRTFCYTLTNFFSQCLESKVNSMRTSQYLFSTLKETPAEAAIVSHQLMLRAGMIRPLASGLYNWMPTGWRVLRKVEKNHS